ncbi:hypothetical protein [Desulfoscipio gibsoniae]|uniref:Uncharacterized protein n=1 Tax=Desulfoscipio gibsoniae DSM 7213 TaxID=767817 RepID=R4KDJ3_9FIRM|nr:hypothetical protein [Desulfoscipio gibsoniae]AGK99761.1 hypothetical protein Desgi_0148 [Desulfoscipio gibsoniae DSM 7213]
MFWMDLIQVKLKSFRGVMPRRGVIWYKLRQSGWLLCRDGNLRAIWGGLWEPVLSIAGHAGLRELSFAGGVRPNGAARLTGVLHYFTRGPNKQS